MEGVDNVAGEAPPFVRGRESRIRDFKKWENSDRLETQNTH
jgi:hypothetical protein